MDTHPGPQKADSSEIRNLFKGEANKAVEDWLAARGKSVVAKAPVYLTRGQFIRVMRQFGFDSKVGDVQHHVMT